MFDFKYSEHSGQIQREGHYSKAETRDATREEVLLWRRVQELERLLDEHMPPEVKALKQMPLEADRVHVNPHDFALLREHAGDRIKMVVHPATNQKGILGEMPVLIDGAPSTLWLVVDREVPKGQIGSKL